MILAYHFFLVLSIVVGSLWRVYDAWDGYDIIVHFSSGVFISLIAYSIFTSNKNNKVGMVWLFVIVFATAMACGGIWEIWEFVTDKIFANNGQNWMGYAEQEALKDTMFDLICDFSGAILGSAIALILENRRIKNEKSDSHTQENTQKDSQ